MVALVILEGVVVAILAFLVVGLLKSHAEILRQLHSLGAGGVGAAGGVGVEVGVDLAAPTLGAAGGATAAHDVIGETPFGEAVALGVTGAANNTLLAFLSSGCTTCAQFWSAFARPSLPGLPPGTRPVVVTRGDEAESITAIRQLAPPEVTVVMSTPAWESYRVPGSPYFVLVDGPAGLVAGEGTGTTWSQVASLMGQALGDRSARPRRSRQGRVDADDAELLAAGIHPGHTSLFATGRTAEPAATPPAATPEPGTGGTSVL